MVALLGNGKEVAGLQNPGFCLQVGRDHQHGQCLLLFLWLRLRETKYPQPAFAAAQVRVSLGTGLR